VPFPLAFSCTRCGLHRECRRLDRVAEEAARFRRACPTGAGGCADDWQQIDVVLTHWSGEIEAISPSYRYWDSANGEARDIARCGSGESDRFYLRRPPGALAGWHFQCVACRTVRPILQRDLRTLESLGPLLDQNQALIAEINMEPVSYRASAAYYPHGDRLLVFDQDMYVSLLGATQVNQLESFIAMTYGYPPTHLTDAEKAALLQAAGRGADWDNYVHMRALVEMLEAGGTTPREMIDASRAALTRQDEDWNATGLPVGNRRRLGSPLLAESGNALCDASILLAWLLSMKLQEKLRGGQLNDGKEVSVDVTILDPFLIPDGLSEREIDRLTVEVGRRRDLLGISEMRLIRDVRICEYTFAYTRTSSSPTVTVATFCALATGRQL
jgi:hypothetical protein